MNYIVYDEDGNITKQVTSKPHLMDMMGYNYIEGEADPKTQCIADGEVVSKSDAVISQERQDKAIRDLRIARTMLLQDTDWTQMPDAPLSDIIKEQYRVYRQELRDLPNIYSNITSIDDVKFPDKPE